MQISFRVEPRDEWRCDALVFFGYEKEQPGGGLQSWMEGPGEWLEDSVALADFKGKAKEITVAGGPSGSLVKRVVLVGLGERGKLELQGFREAVAAAFKRCRDLELGSVGLPVHAFDDIDWTLSLLLEELLVSAVLGLYSYDELKTRDTDQSKQPGELLLFTQEPPAGALEEALAAGRSVGQGVILARDLTNAPSNRATPTFLADTARRMGEEHGFSVTVYEPDQVESMGMGAFAAVFRGSCEPARLIVIDSAPAGHEQDQPIVLVGKGVTFDSGGLSLKPSAKMDEMKTDMAGAAAVLGFFQALGGLDRRCRVVGILPCTDNMPDCRATKPGDVVTTMSGQTVEIVNTDAEGRLLLCDALHFARSFDPALIVDIATLTGACVVALGKHVAAVMGNDQELVSQLQEIGDAVGERIWPMPLWDFFFDELKSEVADMKNVGRREGGALHAAMFLKQFVDDGLPWAHLDIAGPSRADASTPLCPVGATGFGVRTLTEMVRRKVCGDKGSASQE